MSILLLTEGGDTYNEKEENASEKVGQETYAEGHDGRLLGQPIAAGPTPKARLSIEEKHARKKQRDFVRGQTPAVMERRRLKQNAISAALKREVFEHYFGQDPKCEVCGENDIRVLIMHHKNGGGSKHREEIFGNRYYCGGSFYRWLRKNNYPTDHELGCLCSNHHLISKYEETKRVGAARIRAAPA